MEDLTTEKEITYLFFTQDFQWTFIIKHEVCFIQGCHWTFAKITENLRVRASQKMNRKRDKVQKEKDEIGENRERIGPKITENRHPWLDNHNHGRSDHWKGNHVPLFNTRFPINFYHQTWGLLHILSLVTEKWWCSAYMGHSLKMGATELVSMLSKWSKLLRIYHSVPIFLTQLKSCWPNTGLSIRDSDWKECKFP